MTARLSLSKTLDLADLDQLVEELVIVDRHFNKEITKQHPLRRWEYAMALRALQTWRALGHVARVIYDVGGAGSPFTAMVQAVSGPLSLLRIVDPELPIVEGPATLAQELQRHPPLGSAVFCLSVLEHVEDLEEFCRHLGCLVAPSGLLFLTMDYCDGVGDPPIDTYHFRWMRRRIFNEASLQRVRETFQGFTLLGDRDASYSGPLIYDYTFCSLALVKRA